MITGPSGLITANALRSWLEADTESVPVPSEHEALEWAKEAWREADASAFATLEHELEPDRVYALLRVAGEDPSGDPRRIQQWYEGFAQLEWPPGEFDEKLDLASQFAYLISRQYRRAGEPRLSLSWEKRVVELTRQLPSVSDFLALNESDRTEQLHDRFLGNPCVLICLCDGLPHLINLNPAEALRQAAAAHTFVLRSRALGLDDEERRWFLVQLEILVAYGHKHSGDFAEAAKWLDLANAGCDSVREPDSARARIELLFRSIAYERHNYREARVGLSLLSERFERLGMHRNAVLCNYLNGIVLKEISLPVEALAQLNVVAMDESSEVEGWIKGLALIFAADIYAREGESQKAFETLSTAWALVGESKMPTPIGHFHGAKGEILRDLGYLESAIESYRLAVASYESSRFRALEAQLRVILAETLLACGRDGEAISEIATALAIIDTLGLVQEGVVAVALLRESLGRRCANREALMALRQALQAHKERSR